MKTTLLKILFGLLYFLIAVVIGGFAVLVASCDKPSDKAKHESTDARLMIDITEPLYAWPEPKEVLALYGLEADNMRGARLFVTVLSDVSYNRQTPFILEAGGSAITTNRFDRKHEVEAYRERVTAFLDSLTVDVVIGRPKSSLYIPMARQLNDLAKSPFQKRYMLVYSDLRENSASASFYDPNTLAQMRYEPDTLAAKLARLEPLGDLSGITVYLIFQPPNTAADDTYRLVSGFYKRLFEQHGASVKVAANLP